MAKADDANDSKDSIALGDIPKIEKYIGATRIEGLQTLYQVNIARILT